MALRVCVHALIVIGRRGSERVWLPALETVSAVVDSPSGPQSGSLRGGWSCIDTDGWSHRVLQQQAVVASPFDGDSSCYICVTGSGSAFAFWISRLAMWRGILGNRL